MPYIWQKKNTWTKAAYYFSKKLFPHIISGPYINCSQCYSHLFGVVSIGICRYQILSRSVELFSSWKMWTERLATSPICIHFVYIAQRTVKILYGKSWWISILSSMYVSVFVTFINICSLQPALLKHYHNHENTSRSHGSRRSCLPIR
jgi:hypothetical protein